jgi:hypothetical protein
MSFELIYTINTGGEQMARPINPDARYTIKPHTANGYTYASTQPPYIDPETGNKKCSFFEFLSYDDYEISKTS